MLQSDRKKQSIVKMIAAINAQDLNVGIVKVRRGGFDSALTVIYPLAEQGNAIALLNINVAFFED